MSITHQEFEAELRSHPTASYQAMLATRRRFVIWQRGKKFGLVVQTPLPGLAVEMSQKGHYGSYTEARQAAVALGAGRFHKVRSRHWVLRNSPDAEWMAYEVTR